MEYLISSAKEQAQTISIDTAMQSFLLIIIVLSVIAIISWLILGHEKKISAINEDIERHDSERYSFDKYDDIGSWYE